MTLSDGIIAHIENTIRESIKDKLKKYRRETEAMPFHYRLLGQDRMKIFSFVQSVNTTLGMSMYEFIAVTIATPRFKRVNRQVFLGNRISLDAQREIQTIMDTISGSLAPNKSAQVEKIRSVCQSGEMKILEKTGQTHVDLLLEDEQGVIYCFDIKTVKPNKGNFTSLKRTLLEWCAIYLNQHPNADVRTLIAIPYNPYDPKDYNRLTLKTTLDLSHELRVAAEFWDFLGGDGAYQEVLDCFERVGIELKPEIDTFFDNLPTIGSQGAIKSPSPLDTLDFGEETDGE